MTSVATQTLGRIQPGEPLSELELEILKLIALGRTNEMIGRTLGLTSQSVKWNNRRIFRKLGACDRAHAVALGYQQRILTLPPAKRTNRP